MIINTLRDTILDDHMQYHTDISTHDWTFSVNRDMDRVWTSNSLFPSIIASNHVFLSFKCSNCDFSFNQSVYET